MTEHINFLFPSNYDEDFSQEDAFCQIFNPILEPMDIKDEIDPDKVYFVNGKNKVNERSLNNTFNYENFDEFYNRFLGSGEEEDINGDNYNYYFNSDKPSFYNNISKETIFSTFENEKLLNVLTKEYIKEIKCKKYNDNKDNINSENINFIKPKSINREKNKENHKENNYFPFTQGKGLINGYSFKLIDESNLSTNFPFIQKTLVGECGLDEEIINDENSQNTEQMIGTENPFFKFKTKKYYTMPNGKKRREKKKRKFKSDDIRKKIKSRFHKTLKNIINDLLKDAGSKQIFDFLPQCFIGNISKKVNEECLELSYKEILSKNFVLELNKDKEFNNKADYKKFLKNQEILEYLEKNPEISKDSGFDFIKDKKYKDLLKLYFSSSEFEESIIRLKQENEGNDYIQEYIFRAKNYVDFYGNSNSEEKNDVESNEE